MVFEKSDYQQSHYRRPWKIFTWNGFDHTWLFYPKIMGPPGPDTRHGAIKVESLANCLETEFWDCEPGKIAFDIIKDDSILDIVKIRLPIPNNLSYTIHGFINCVTIVKFVMGLNKWFIMTPQQLHRYLLRNGGRSLKYGEVPWKPIW